MGRCCSSPAHAATARRIFSPRASRITRSASFSASTTIPGRAAQTPGRRPCCARPSPFQALPKEAVMRVAVRRSLRVGPQAGTEVEDLGVTPDIFYKMTRDDLLKGNVNMIEAAAAVLAAMPVYVLAARLVADANGRPMLDIETKGIDRIDVFADGRPQSSQQVAHGKSRIGLDATVNAGSMIANQGYNQARLAAGRGL